MHGYELYVIYLGFDRVKKRAIPYIRRILQMNYCKNESPDFGKQMAENKEEAFLFVYKKINPL
jgi:hypothetical protein